MWVNARDPIISLGKAARKTRGEFELRREHLLHNAPCSCAMQVHPTDTRSERSMRIKHGVRKSETAGDIGKGWVCIEKVPCIEKKPRIGIAYRRKQALCHSGAGQREPGPPEVFQ